MLENENQTKVHFKMYKDGKRWVTRGLALFAVSLMVGGPVAGTVANVANVEASEVQVSQGSGDAYDILQDNLDAVNDQYGYLANYTIVKNVVAKVRNVKPSYSYRGQMAINDANEQLVNVIIAAQNGYDVVKQYTGYTQDAALTQALAKVTADLNGTNLDALVADNKTAVRLGLQADLKLAQDAINSGKFTQNMDQITQTVTSGNGTFSATQQMNPGDYDKVNDAELKLRDALAGLRQVAKNQLDQEISVAKSNQDSSTADLTKAIENAENVSNDNSSDALDMLGADAALQAEVSKVQQKSAHDADTTSDLGKTRAENEAAVENSMATSAAKSAAIASELAAGQHNADSTASDASANDAKASSDSAAASAAANSEAQSMINAGRESNSAMEQSLANSASASQAASLANAAGRDSNAAMESSLAASAAESQATSFANESARQSNAAMEQSLANSASASQAASQANAAGRESNAAMEQSLANSALASSVAAEEAKQGQHYATSVASEAATNNQNVADFNNQKSAAVAEANKEASAQHVANDQNVVNDINNIKNATDADSLTDAADKAAIAIANAASRNVAAPRVVNTNVVSNTAVSGVNGAVVNAGNQASANAVAGTSTPTPVTNTTAGAVAPIANATVATASVNNGAATQAANADNGRHPKKAAIHDRKAVAEGSKSLHDTQMTNKHTGLLTSLISALVAAVLALFFLFFWKRRKQQEEENVAANADEALLKDVQNTKDSWK
ncbi:KxYKxGKxW signal peptide domain-containing protein [Weissella confusa]|uniref:KxYKxGKxW signal peptide domain-containing protein n=1 Tax=Weissella confusa TaxID=1583 RepID=UPI00189A8D37|nr:KxYKxGKxW signal peptide domain-containing protein [Weissella confusa]